MIYGYARCSTTEQQQDIARQVRELTAQGATHVFSEYIRGTTHEKPELKQVFSVMCSGDILTVTEVSRFSRDVHQLCHVLEIAQDKRIIIKSGVLSLDFTTGNPDPMNRAMFLMMGVFAELERCVTVERIRSGIDNARVKGTILGRPRKTAEDVPQSVCDLVPAFQRGEITATELAKKTGLSRPVIYKYFALLGVGLNKNRRMTAVAVPSHVRELYPKYKARQLTQVEFARQAGYARNTIRSYIALLDSEQ